MTSPFLFALALVTQPADSLLVGVKSFAAPGSPGNIVVWGAGGRAVSVDRDGRPTVVSVEAQGRIVAFAHNGTLSASATGQTLQLFENAVKWCASGSPSSVLSPHSGIVEALRRRGLPAQAGKFNWTGGKGEVIIADAHQITPSDVAPLQAFVRRGGGLIIAATGWGWQQGSQRPMSEFDANRAIRPFGLGFGDGFTEKDSGGVFQVRPGSAESHAGHAIEALLSGSQGNPLAGRTAVDLLRVLPSTDPWLANRVQDLRKSTSLEVSAQKPLRQSDGKNRFLAALDWQSIERGDFKGSAPSSSSFPGAVPKEAKRVTKSISLRPNESRWLSTGMYAAPGETVTVTISEGIAPGSTLRIGGHTDGLWHLDEWQRFPEVSLSWPLKAGQTTATSPFGGLIYVDLAKPLAENRSLEIRGAVSAPRFVLGQTSAAEWRRQLREDLGPWAEIESDHIVVTVPRTAVEKLVDPTEVAKFWDRIADATADLAQIPRWRGFKERFMADQQISAGYMHSGYPIMTWLDVIGHVTDVDRLKKEGSWGHFHEIGHNHQNADWTFDGTGEVTVNLFTLYAYDTVVGKRPADRSFSDQACLVAFEKHRKAGAPFEKWKDDPFLALTMYAQLQNAFGWDTFKRVFKAYHALTPAQRPKNDAQKRDLWMTMFSGEVNRNLGPFFQAWGVPVSEEAKVSVANFKVWLPEGMEMP